MKSRDFHKAPKQEPLAEIHLDDVRFTFVKHWWGKNDIAYSLHISPSSYTTAGLQKTDFLNYIGFKLSHGCTFLSKCYARWVTESFNVDDFSKSFSFAYDKFIASEKNLRSCGFFLEQPEGWYFFTGRYSFNDNLTSKTPRDGHLGNSIDERDKSEDNLFLYKFTWVENNGEKFWTTHYYPKQTALSPEFLSVFKFLGIQEYEECPQFEFDPCYWRSVYFERYGDRHFDTNVRSINDEFKSHAQLFLPGVEELIVANAEMEKFDFGFLPVVKPKVNAEQKISPTSNQTKTQTSTTVRNTENVTTKQGVQNPTAYEVAISFAGTERESARELAETLKAKGVSVFFDEFHPEKLWGSDLVKYLASVFEKESRYCVIFISKDYKEQAWPNHELRSAQARALEDGGGYILPIQVDDTKLDGLPSTIGYRPIADGIEKIAEILIRKLRS